MGNGSGGYPAEPAKMLDYAQTITKYAASFAQAAGAATEVMDDNQITVGGTGVALDRAFGVLCQGAGIATQRLEQHALESLDNALSMMHALAAKLAANAKAYQGNDSARDKQGA